MKIVATKPDAVGPTLPEWRREMRRAIRDPQQLADRLGLPAEQIDPDANRSFGLFAPLPFVDRIETGNLNDPLLLQLLPQEAENRRLPDFLQDPVADRSALRGPGMIQKYPGRVLLVLTGACAIHCRYCFRREFPYSDQQAWRANWLQTLQAIREDPSLSEVILSGGDPMTLDDSAWQQIVGDLEQIQHLRQLRIHTRLPIMIPSRITDRWVDCVSGSRLTCVLVIHSNHAAELDAAVQQRLLQAAARMTILNQSVLLRRINDRVEILKELSERLLACRVLPYYLNLLDRVSGAAHFEVPEAEGIELMRRLRECLPGYLVPRLVRDEGTGHCKRVVA